MERKAKEWARELAYKRSYPTARVSFSTIKYVGGNAFEELARTIEKYENSPPVDPILIEARKICNQFSNYGSSFYLNGDWDNTVQMKVALHCLRKENKA